MIRLHIPSLRQAAGITEIEFVKDRAAEWGITFSTVHFPFVELASTPQMFLGASNPPMA